MRRVITAVIATTMVIAAAAAFGIQGDAGRSFYTTYASSWADRAAGVSNVTTRTADVLLDIISNFPTRNVSVVLDGGKWYCETNVSFPSNICVSIAAGSGLYVTNNCTVSFWGGLEMPENRQVFWCEANSQIHWPTMVISNPAWWGQAGDIGVIKLRPGSVGSNELADGSVSTQKMTSAAHNAYDNQQIPLYSGVGTTGLAHSASTAAGFLNADGNFYPINTNGGVSATNATDLMYDGTNSPNLLQSFMGFPRLTVSTNSITAYSSAGGTLILPTNYLSFFDTNITTASSTASLAGNSGHTYVIDLGTRHTGVVIVRDSINTAGAATYANSKLAVSDIGGADAGTYTYSYGPHTFWDAPLGVAMTNFFIYPYSGRYIRKVFSNPNGATACDYKVFEILVYGVTNAMNNVD
jgi:hypothetical protein